MQRLSILGLATALCWSTAACSPQVDRSSGPDGPSASMPAASSGPPYTDMADLRREIRDIKVTPSARVKVEPIASTPRRHVPQPVSVERAPPRLASDHPAFREAEFQLVETPPARLARETEKMGTEGERAVASGKDWRKLRFADSHYEPRLDADQAPLALDDRIRARGYVYAFLILNEYLSDQVEKQLSGLSVEIIGPHGSALKVRAPADPERLRRIAALDFVEWIGHAPAEQKLAAPLQKAIAEYARQLPAFPVIINAFDEAAMRELRTLLAQTEVTVGREHHDLNAISAVATPEMLSRLADLDSVLFIELSVPGGGGHDNSMAVMGVDYIRPGGPGTRFSGAPAILGILDTGFMVGGAAATTHQDLNKFGCGVNFTSDAAGVWNDQNGHGTHVLATAIGTGTGEARFRGAATGVGSTATTRLRAAKIWDSTNTGTQTEELDGHDYMNVANSCGSGRPHVVNLSGGASGTNLVGTDARSRKLDQTVWNRRQTWVVCSGNNGPGAGTIWTAGVAKNALTVGNVLDTGDGQIGSINNASSRGPAGDGRMKPNIVATGTTIRSANAGSTSGYTNMFGCSMATPHVSGIAATVMEHYPEFRNLPHLMRAHLMATALLRNNDATPARNTEAPDTTRNTFGLGRASPYVAHWAHPNPSGWTTHWSWRTITRERWGFRDIEVPRGASRLVVVMTWDEPAASAGAAAAVDYDLDLWIDRTPFCTPDSKGQCGEWASQSWIDNVEYLIIENPPAGTYRLKVVNWNAPSSGLPAAIAATVIRGATAPNMGFGITASPINPGLGGRTTITTTVSNPSWVLSGVHLENTILPAGVTLESVQTRREDNVLMDFTAERAMSLGNIVQGDSRSATWRVRIDTGGPKVLRFRARSENGGLREQSVTLNPGTS